MLRAVQTTLAKGEEKEGMTLYQWYAKVLHDIKSELQRMSRYIVADAAFSKKSFVKLILPDGFHLVSRLRNDAVLYYIWYGGRTGKKDPDDGEAYALKAKCKSLNMIVSLVIHVLPEGGYKLYFSTDEQMSGKDVIEYYKTRFQIEFNFRDAKQFTGLTDSQARSTNKFDFAYNASFAAVNLAKIVRREYAPELSIGKFKALMVNIYYLQRIIDVFESKMNMTFNDKLFKELFSIAARAA